MNELYVKSEDIAIVPVAKKRTGNIGLLTERNLTAIVKATSHSDSFVRSIRHEQSDDGGYIDVEFVIGGYCVDATLSQKWLAEQGITSKTPLYAVITIDENGEISGQDDGGVYKGVKFTFVDENPAGSNTIRLKLFNWDGEQYWEIPESYGTVVTKQLIIGGIDGKH